MDWLFVGDVGRLFGAGQRILHSGRRQFIANIYFAIAHHVAVETTLGRYHIRVAAQWSTFNRRSDDLPTDDLALTGRSNHLAVNWYPVATGISRNCRTSHNRTTVAGIASGAYVIRRICGNSSRDRGR